MSSAELLCNESILANLIENDEISQLCLTSILEIDYNLAITYQSAFKLRLI